MGVFHSKHKHKKHIDDEVDESMEASIDHSDLYGSVLKTKLDDLMQEFIRLFCILDNVYFVPSSLLKAAWMDYLHMKGKEHLMYEYYQNNMHKMFGDIFFHPSVIHDPSGMLIGISLYSWPGKSLKDKPIC